jgi:2-polyprenyl-6-methoxyphenol hydroxylase-like FAD-dependent oxidoreductase
MFEKHKTEVLVVGAGPVGLYTALLLAEQGIEVQIVEEQWRAASRSYALALHPASLKLLGEAGLAEQLVPAGYRVDRLVFYDRLERVGEMRFTDLGGDFPFVLVLPQEGLELLLRGRLERQKVKVLWNHRVAQFSMNDEQVDIRVERLGKDSSGYAVARTEWVIDKSLNSRARFLVGADGHRSMVRRALGIDFESVGRAQTFAVFEFISDGIAEHEMRIVFDEGRTSVLWPMGNGRFRWSFEIEAPDDVVDPRVKSRLFVQVRDESYPYVTEEKLEELIGERAPWFEANIAELLWSAVIRFEKRLAGSFGRQRAWLAGDAGHLAFPVGIQSMNVGFREASRLSRKLGKVLRGSDPISSLRTYEDETLLEWRQLLGITDPVEAAEDAADWVKTYAERIPSCIPASGEDLKTLLQGIGLTMINSFDR